MTQQRQPAAQSPPPSVPPHAQRCFFPESGTTQVWLCSDAAGMGMGPEYCSLQIVGDTPAQTGETPDRDSQFYTYTFSQGCSKGGVRVSPFSQTDFSNKVFLGYSQRSSEEIQRFVDSYAPDKFQLPTALSQRFAEKFAQYLIDERILVKQEMWSKAQNKFSQDDVISHVLDLGHVQSVFATHALEKQEKLISKEKKLRKDLSRFMICPLEYTNPQA